MSELLTTARPYAKALFKIAKEQGMIDEYFIMLKNLLAAVEDKNLTKILSNELKKRSSLSMFFFNTEINLQSPTSESNLIPLP